MLLRRDSRMDRQHIFECSHLKLLIEMRSVCQSLVRDVHVDTARHAAARCEQDTDNDLGLWRNSLYVDTDT